MVVLIFIEYIFYGPMLYLLVLNLVVFGFGGGAVIWSFDVPVAVVLFFSNKLNVRFLIFLFDKYVSFRARRPVKHFLFSSFRMSLFANKKMEDIGSE